MFYYKAKNGGSLLALKRQLTVKHYPEYTQVMINGYEEITKQQFEILKPKDDE